MAVTGVSPSPREIFLTQVERLVTSDILKGSEALCRLVRYLALHAIDTPGAAIKEYQIATEVFGRASDFDPRLDSTVRVQTGRLRSKLAEYYAGPGAEDRLVIDLPKGSYSLSIHERLVANVPASLPSPAPVVAPAAKPPEPAVTQQRPVALIATLWTLGAVTIGLIAALLMVIQRTPTSVHVHDKVPPALRTFWHGFIDQPERPLVVFSNAAFVGRPETGMRYFEAHRDANTAILDHYTGVGEVIAVHELDSLFTSLDHAIRVKRGRLLSLDDAKNNDLIFIGSPSENLSLREVPSTQDFVFRLAESGPRKGDLEIVNVNPKAGEASAFWGSPAVPISEDYAVIGLVPGLNPTRWIMLLAGTTTIGTQAAVELVTHPKNVEELVSKVGVKDGGIRPFEAVIKVKVTGGVPVVSDIVALHPRPDPT